MKGDIYNQYISNRTKRSNFKKTKQIKTNKRPKFIRRYLVTNDNIINIKFNKQQLDKIESRQLEKKNRMASYTTRKRYIK